MFTVGTSACAVEVSHGPHMMMARALTTMPRPKCPNRLKADIVVVANMNVVSWFPLIFVERYGVKPIHSVGVQVNHLSCRIVMIAGDCLRVGSSLVPRL